MKKKRMKQTVLNIIILTVSITNLSVSALSPLRKVNNAKVEGRRQFLSSAVAVGGLFTCLPSAFAKAPPSGLEGDKAKIVAGYKRLNYLLDNWEKVCLVYGTQRASFFIFSQHLYWFRLKGNYSM